jgi:hypothetical protein
VERKRQKERRKKEEEEEEGVGEGGEEERKAHTCGAEVLTQALYLLVKHSAIPAPLACLRHGLDM